MTHEDAPLAPTPAVLMDQIELLLAERHIPVRSDGMQHAYRGLKLHDDDLVVAQLAFMRAGLAVPAFMKLESADEDASHDDDGEVVLPARLRMTVTYGDEMLTTSVQIAKDDDGTMHCSKSIGPTAVRPSEERVRALFEQYDEATLRRFIGEIIRDIHEAERAGLHDVDPPELQAMIDAVRQIRYQPGGTIF